MGTSSCLGSFAFRSVERPAALITVRGFQSMLNNTRCDVSVENQIMHKTDVEQCIQSSCTHLVAHTIPKDTTAFKHGLDNIVLMDSVTRNAQTYVKPPANYNFHHADSHTDKGSDIPNVDFPTPTKHHGYRVFPPGNLAYGSQHSSSKKRTHSLIPQKNLKHSAKDEKKTSK